MIIHAKYHAGLLCAIIIFLDRLPLQGMVRKNSPLRLAALLPGNTNYYLIGIPEPRAPAPTRQPRSPRSTKRGHDRRGRCTPPGQCRGGQTVLQVATTESASMGASWLSVRSSCPPRETFPRCAVSDIPDYSTPPEAGRGLPMTAISSHDPPSHQQRNETTRTPPVNEAAGSARSPQGLR